MAAAGALFAGDALATEGYFQNGIGARHKALAGAGVADGKDATTITLNPAGLVDAGHQINGAVSLFMPFREYKATGPGFIAPGGPSGTIKSRRNFFVVPNIAYSRQLDDESAIGFTMSGNGGMNTAYPNAFNSNAGFSCPPGSSGVFCGGKTGVDLMQMIISGGYARRLGQYVSIGVAPMLVVQRIKVKGLGLFAGFPGLTVSPANLSNRGYSYSAGFGVRGGVEFKPTDNLRIGIAYQTRTYMSKFKKYRGLFENGGDFDIPANVQVGIAADLTPDLTVMVDYKHIFYKSIDAIGNLFPGASLGSNGGAGFGWKDVDVMKFGAEYKASEDLTLRAGYSYNTQPIRSSQVTLNLIAPAVSQHHITGGGSYKISPNSQIDFAAMFSPSAKVSGIEVTPFGPNPFRVITLKMHQVEVTAGYTYHFN